ncbi:hypothetical protein IQ07DRAFT_38100 [Pyrenochaeta sp. DS3sAY3a]|nr:hypothetical protein IQ07DRAFT_38100 [Pyrenochaeta sp. DS3sAY3a]
MIASLQFSLRLGGLDYESKTAPYCQRIPNVGSLTIGYRPKLALWKPCISAQRLGIWTALLPRLREPRIPIVSGRRISAAESSAGFGCYARRHEALRGVKVMRQGDDLTRTENQKSNRLCGQARLNPSWTPKGNDSECFLRKEESLRPLEDVWGSPWYAAPMRTVHERAR